GECRRTPRRLCAGPENPSPPKRGRGVGVRARIAPLSPLGRGVGGEGLLSPSPPAPRPRVRGRGEVADPTLRPRGKVLMAAEGYPGGTSAAARPGCCRCR